MMRGVRRATLALAAVLVTLLAPSAARAEGLDWRPCKERLGCATLTVPLDRSGAVPGSVKLAVQRQPVRRGQRRGVTVLLAGGPGQSAISAYDPSFDYGDGTYAQYAALAPGNDVVVFDQRGTGRSGLLRCRDLEAANPIDPARATEACAALLGKRRAFYTTSDSVDDLEALRLALGGPKLTLIGVSYGTYVAQRYAVRYPHGVDRMVLDSVVDTTGVDALYRDTFAAANRTMGRYCRRGCGFTGDVAADVAALSARIAREPVSGTVGTSRGARKPADVTRAGLLYAWVAGDMDPLMRARYPAAVASALRGDADPILRLQQMATQPGGGGDGREFSSAVLAAALCEEAQFPYARDTPFDARPGLALVAAQQLGEAAFAPFDLWTAARNDLLRLCRNWPASGTPDRPMEGPLPDVPTLLLAGSLDTRTPVETARRVAAQLPRATLVEVPNSGHSVLGTGANRGCARNAVKRFLADRPVRSRCKREPSVAQAMRMVPTSLAGVDPMRPLRGNRGRVLYATIWTVGDGILEGLNSASGLDPWSDRPSWNPGLRGGRHVLQFGFEGWRMLFERVELIPGLRVSGHLEVQAVYPTTARLRIHGPAGPNGWLRVRGDVTRGRIGGVGFRVKGLKFDDESILASAASQPPPTLTAAIAELRRRLAAPPRPTPTAWPLPAGR